MRNQSSWKQSKFVLINGQLVANRDTSCVSVASRLNVDLLGAALKRVISRFAHGRLLDMGCGAVPLFSEYRHLVSNVVCADWSNSLHNNCHLDLVVDLNAPLPIASKQFETVLLTDVLEHIAAPEQLLREIRRLLCHDGILIGSVPFLYRLHEEPHDYYRYTIHTLRSLATKHGFAIEILEPYGAGTDVLFDALGKLLVNLHWKLGSRLASWSQSLGAFIGKSAFGRRINQLNQSMPLGYVFVFRSI